MNQGDGVAGDDAELFVQLLTQHQNRIYAYIFSLVGDHARSADIVQETNLVLWRKAEEYDKRRPFLNWAFTFARNQVLANLRDKSRDRLLLDDDLVQLMGEEAQANVGQLEAVQTALKSCLKKLTEKSRELVENRYFQTRSINEMAESTGQSVGALKVALVRVRKQLGNCIQHQVASDQ